MNVLTILSIPHPRAESKSTDFLLLLRDISARLSNLIRNFEAKSRKSWLWAHKAALELTDLLRRKERREEKKRRRGKKKNH